MFSPCVAFTHVPVFVILLPSVISWVFSDVIIRAEIEKQACFYCPLKNWNYLWSIYEEVYSVFLICHCSSENTVKVKTECRRWLIYRYSLVPVPHTSLCFLLLWIQPSSPVLRLFIPLSLDNLSCQSVLLSHERMPSPLHHSSLWLARPFQVGEPLPDNNLVWLLEQRGNWLICSPCLRPWV